MLLDDVGGRYDLGLRRLEHGIAVSLLCGRPGQSR